MRVQGPVARGQRRRFVSCSPGGLSPASCLALGNRLAGLWANGSRVKDSKPSNPATPKCDACPLVIAGLSAPGRPPQGPALRLLPRDSTRIPSTIGSSLPSTEPWQPNQPIIRAETFSPLGERKEPASRSMPALKAKTGGDERIRTAESGFCRPLPYHLATSPLTSEILS